MATNAEELVRQQAAIRARNHRDLEETVRSAQPAMAKLADAYVAAGVAMVKGVAKAMERHSVRLP